MTDQEIEIGFFNEFGITLKEAELSNKDRMQKIISDFEDMAYCVMNGLEWDFDNARPKISAK